MTDRDKLIDLLYDVLDARPDTIADHLLANGVIVLPCQKGAVLNRNGEKCIANHWNIILTAFNEDNHVRLFDIKEAEAKLKECEKE
jgi:hypothetical protein